MNRACTLGARLVSARRALSVDVFPPTPLSSTLPVTPFPSQFGNGTLSIITSPAPTRTPHVSSNSALFSVAFSLASAAVSRSNRPTRALISRSNSLFRLLDAADASRFARNRFTRRLSASSITGASSHGIPASSQG